MNRYVEDVRRTWTEGLGSAAYEYLEAGLDMSTGTAIPRPPARRRR